MKLINMFNQLNYQDDQKAQIVVQFFYNRCSTIKQQMFEDLFDTQEEIATGVKEGQVLSAWDRLPRSCADALPLPELARKPGYPIGLKNQGATCYLNSLLQILFHTPELRKTILDLPLCVGSIECKSDFLNSSKHKFMLGFQRLFSEMSLKDTYDLSTEYLKQAFGWEGSEHIVQHDIEEAMKIIFDTFQRALDGTKYEKNIKDLFKGTSSRYKSCKFCTATEERLEEFYGLNLQVQNYHSLEESILNYLTAESMEGDNKVYCETCQMKQDMWLGSKLKVLPNVLVFTLARFAFNYETFDRIKLNSFFSFNLQTNLKHLLDDQEANAGNDAEYELYGVLIHRGSAHSGHYFCFIRDLMQESDWKVGLQQAENHQQEQVRKEKEKDNIMTEEQKARQSEKNKEDKTFELMEPLNKKLLENWFQLDDGRVTAIEANKITTKYEGSESAYILFYRRRSIPLPSDIQIPEYFSKQIETENREMEKQREEYQAKKNQIILNIDGNDEILSLDTRLNDIVDIYCGYGWALVNEAKHNGLPYYPKQISSLKQYSDADTVKSIDLIHESKWRKYKIDSDDYINIQPYIEVARMPFQINLYFNDKNEKMLLYQDQTLSCLKMKIQQKYQINYESQIIKLVTAYRQYFVTDDLSNDDVLLTKLGFVHECQAILKQLEAGHQADDLKKVEEKIETNTICFVIERDDVHGIKRMYFDKQKTLQQLFDFICTTEGLDNQSPRRLRNLNGDRLFYSDQYSKTLQQLDFSQEIVKLRIERGEVPIKGDICVIAKMQSKFQSQDTPPEIQCIFDPNTTILELKERICTLANLKPELHRVYQTDWMGEPVRSITKEKQSVFDAKFGKEEKICIRDIESPIGAELINFEVYSTSLGTPEDIKEPFAHIKIEDHKTLKDLKTEILKACSWSNKEQIKVNQLRIREIKKDYMFGVILRDSNKQVKNYSFNTNKIVVQLLSQEEQLTENQIVLVLKKRNKEKRLFEGHTQLIFQAGKTPSIQDLNLAIHKRLQIPQSEKLKIAKYVHYDFEWAQISEKHIQKILKSKANKTETANKAKNKKEGKRNQEKKGDSGQTQQSAGQKQEPTTTPIQQAEDQQKRIENLQYQGSEVPKQKTEKQKEAPSQKQKVQVKKGKQQKQHKDKQEHKKENNKEANEKDNRDNKDDKDNKDNNKEEDSKKEDNKKEDCLNLRKFPYLLKDGDWIGFGKVDELEGDDFQTDEDQILRTLKRNEKAIAKQSRGPEKAFKVNIDF